MTFDGWAFRKIEGGSQEPGSRELAAALAASVANMATVAASAAQCDIGQTWADVDVITDSNGDLIYRCNHTPPHRWKMNGTRIP